MLEQRIKNNRWIRTHFLIPYQEYKWRPILQRTRKRLYDWFDTAEKIVIETDKRNAFGLTVGFCQGINTIGDSHSYLPYHMTLYLLTRFYKPKTIIETGVERGSSTFVILQALWKNGSGKLHSIDMVDRFPMTRWETAPIVPIHLRNDDVWQFHKGLSTDVLERFGMFMTDMFVAGSDHSEMNQLHEIAWGWNHLNRGGILVIDRPDYNAYKAFNAFLMKYPNECSEAALLKESRHDLPNDFLVLMK